ncbi:RsmD family RNA methyltransferase [Aeromicrobium wangtongii]|uniref:RsmD family RNA methyltransferase n=1 Tax=Aeromicrobium wangtongii TaxID=2969247 RepID=UPI0035570900
MVVSQAPSSMTFAGLEVWFDDRVLRPREWTQAQSDWAAELLDDAPAGQVLELFAGVGHIGLAAVAANARELVMVDLNPVACDLARRNADAAGMGARVEIRQGRIDEVLGSRETFPVIIADPPWVPTAGIGEFPEDPTIAIDGGEDGLALARIACEVVDRHLAPGGSAILQLGNIGQADQLDAHLEAAGSQLGVVETRTFERGVLVRLGVRAGSSAG